MTFDQVALLTIIAITLILFVLDKWRYDIVALLSLFACGVLNIIPPQYLFSGFGHPATITLAFVLVLSYGLTKSGAIEGLLKLIEPVAKYPTIHITVLLFLAAFLSMFMNNVGALALLMPIAIQSTLKANRSPATVLMPLSFGSILGGLVTLIGTPPNIIISSYNQKVTGQPFYMFDFAPVGGAVAIAGILFMLTIGWRLVRVRKSSTGESLFEIESYLFEVKVNEKSKIIDLQVRELDRLCEMSGVNLVSVLHKKQYVPVSQRLYNIQHNNLLMLEGSQEDIDKFVSKYNLSLLGAESAREEIFHSEHTKVMEIVVSPNSRLLGRTVGQIRFKYLLGINLLAVSRQGRSYRSRLRQLTFRSGDVLLIHGEHELVDTAIQKLNCFPLAKRSLDFGKRKKNLLSLAIFCAAVAFASFGMIPIPISFGLAMLAMVLLNIIPIREFYDAINWPVVFLIGAMLPIGQALESTGITALITSNILAFTGTQSLTLLLAFILIITMTLSDILNNAATAILMAPIAVNISEATGVSATPFLMAVAVGASCAFLTPIGHQNNALVMGPGGYQFGDYWRIGLPLEIIICAVAIPLIPIVWPY